MVEKVVNILEITDTSFRINGQAFKSVLRKVGNRPFVLYSINGATRTGKSFALNYFIRYYEAKKRGITDWFNTTLDDRFEWKSGKERTTVGVNLWSEPYFIRHNGREIAILLMDCQGLFDEQTTARQNAIIFSLSTLCSSVSIFNLMKNIDENVLQQLQFFSGYASLAFNDDEVQSGFQNLIFLIRDFDFPDYEFGYHDSWSAPGSSAANFYKDTFDRVNSKRSEENILTREKIQMSFRDIGVFALPHPGKNFVRAAPGNETIRTDDDFNDSLSEFIELVNSNEHLVLKTIAGKEVAGDEFMEYVDAWAKICDRADEHFPPVQTMAESASLIQNSNARSNASSYFKGLMDDYMASHPDGVSQNELMAAHARFETQAIELFNKMRSMGGEAVRLEYREKLKSDFEKMTNSHIQYNQIILERELMREDQKRRELELERMGIEMANLSEENAEAKREMFLQIQRSNEEMEKLRNENMKREQQYQQQMQNLQQQVDRARHEHQAMVQEIKSECNRAIREMQKNHKREMREMRENLEINAELQSQLAQERLRSQFAQEQLAAVTKEKGKTQNSTVVSRPRPSSDSGRASTPSTQNLYTSVPYQPAVQYVQYVPSPQIPSNPQPSNVCRHMRLQ